MREIHPLTPDRFPAFEALMGPKGGSGGCWCMLWRRTAAEMRAAGAAENRATLRAVVEAGPPPGLLAYEAGVPVGWISVAPRAAFPRLATSRVLRPVDERPVWSVSCFLVRRERRGTGVATELLGAACDAAAGMGARWIEGYPIDPGDARYAPAFAWTGVAAIFRACGFVEIARRSDTRPIMRRRLGPPGAPARP